MTRERPIRVAIIGGGCAGMTAAFELSKPEHAGRYEVTVYQRGFRLGGKGASGRGPEGRIEEHGLHVWMGYYENAFRLMRECYAELGRDPTRCPIATIDDAFVPASYVAAADQRADGSWLAWQLHFPSTPGLPGEPDERYRPPGVAEYMRRLLALARKLVESSLVRGSRESRQRPLDLASNDAEGLRQGIARLLGFGVLAGLGALLEALRLLELAFEVAGPVPETPVLQLLDAARAAAQVELERYLLERDELRRTWAIVDLVLATVRGSIRHRLLTHPRGFDAIDHYDCREWLLANGASRLSLQSAFVRALYDLGFAYEDGDLSRPRIAAGAGMRGFLRAFFTYRGAFFWKMTAGMGDIVFAPLYEVLARRGVRFEFFHALRNVGLAAAASTGPAHVERLEFDLQARTRDGSPYAPLVNVGGLPCFPSEPDAAQLEGWESAQPQPSDFELQGAVRALERRTLWVGQDFDLAVLAIGVGAVPATCAELIEREPRWRAMVEHVKSVPTKALQLWLTSDVSSLGWRESGVSLSGFAEPFDTWADMTHLLPRETWAESPRALAYFCSVLRDDPAWIGKQGRAAAMQAVRADACRFLERELGHLWPASRTSAGGFRWDLLCCAAGRNDQHALDSQYWTANIDPSDRYVLSLPDSNEHRISPLDRTYDNLTVAGDWTDCGLNLGCVEAAVMSGLLAAHAISKSPPLERIVGFDHP